MTTILLTLAALVVFGLLIGAVCLMLEDGSTWFVFMMTGVPQGLLKVLGVLVMAILENVRNE